jgi:hypothetical protein
MKQLFGTRILDYLPALGLVAITVLYLATAYSYDARAREIPVAVGWVMLVLLALDLVSRTRTPVGHALLRFLNPAAEETPEERYPMPRQLSALAWVAFYVVGLLSVGVLIATPLYVFGSMRFHGKRTYFTALLTAVLVTAFTWTLFDFALRVELYPGFLFEDY